MARSFFFFKVGKPAVDLASGSVRQQMMQSEQNFMDKALGIKF